MREPILLELWQLVSLGLICAAAVALLLLLLLRSWSAKTNENSRRLPIEECDTKTWIKRVKGHKNIGWQTKPLLNWEETQIHDAVQSFILKWNKNEQNPEDERGLRLIMQVPLGEILKLQANQKKGDQRESWYFFETQCRRVDLLIIDRENNPVLAIEHNGEGHYEEPNHERRDEWKRSALRSAGIGTVYSYSGFAEKLGLPDYENCIAKPWVMGNRIVGPLKRYFKLRRKDL